MNPFRIGRGLVLLGVLLASSVLAAGQSLIPASSSWRILPGTAEPPAAWRETGFSDGAWASGNEPFHSGTLAGGTPLTGFGTAFSSVYLRRSFTVAQPEKVGELILDALVDDGFVAWLNGHEIVRHNAPEGALSRSAAALEGVPEPLTEETFPVATPWNWLRPGENVLAIHLLNAPAAGEPDVVWNATLSATVDLTPPVAIAQVPPPGSTVDSLLQAEVIFSEPVSGLDAGDLLVNGMAATNVVPVAPGHYRFEFPAPAPGTVQFAFADGHGIGDELGQPNGFAASTWSVQLNPDASRHNVILSELMADSYRSLKDEDGDYPDWIELANTGGTAIDLRGWALTDDKADRFKWHFGNVVLPANGYLVVFASQKNKTNVTTKTKLHTSFKLSNNGEYLALVAPDGEVVSQFDPFPEQRLDVSWGRAPGAPELTAYFASPTPGARNSGSGAGFAPDVTFSAASRNYTDSFPLRLSAPDPGAVIRYTLNGAVPTNGSPVYTAPITITTTVEVRARAFREGQLPGPVHSETFIRLTSDPAHRALFTSTLPILVMSTVRNATLTETRNTAVQFSLHEPVDGRASLLLPPQFTSRGGAKIRGSSSATLEKKPYAIEWWDEFNEDDKHGVLGLPADSEWVLYAPNVYDPVMIHNPFIHQLSRDLGQYSPRTRFVELYLQRTNGVLLTNHWAGIYVLEEKPAIDGNRLDIDKLQPEDVAFPEITGGYLMKVDRLDPGDGGINLGSTTGAMVEPKEPELKSSQRAPQFTYIKGHLAAFNRALNSTNWRDPLIGYLPYVDLTNWIDYHVVEVLSGNVDSLVLSAYFHKERSGPLKWGPHWDFDRALGSTDGRDQNPRSWLTGPFFSAVWWSKVLKDPTAWQLWVDRYQEFRAGGMSRSNLNRLVDRLAAEVAPSQKREEKRWSFMRPRGGSYQAEVNLMKNWLSNRVDFLDRQMTARPTLSSAGGRVAPGFTVTLTRPAGSTVYYTLDGTDPRLAFGTNQVAPGALVYSGPITINGYSRLVARAHDPTKRQAGGPLTTTPWSGPVAATFTVADPPLTVAEIMFHPAKPTADGGPDEDEFEFIELRNTSAQTVALPGYRLHGGVDLVFTSTNDVTTVAAGQRLVLVANRAAFASRYPGVLVGGEYAGHLGNAGARIALTGPLLEPVFDFAFEDRWQLLADGSGFSLARLADGTAANDPNRAESWRLSGRFGGSPGQADPEPLPPATLPGAIRLSEIYTGAGKQNFIELEAAAGKLAGPVDLSGWWLTDERDDWSKFRLPVGSVLSAAGAGARLVVRESQFDLPAGAGFKLNPLGGEVWLFSANAGGELTGFLTGGSYGVTDAGQSLIDDGVSLTEQNFVLGRTPSPGTPNGLPLTGPVIFRSVHFHPPALGTEDNTRDEFIELENLAAEPVPLFAPANPAFTWHLRGGVELDLPAGLTLPAGGRVLMVGFAPESDPAALNAFLARHSPNDNLTLIGPWRGHLGNHGDSLRLKRPLSSTTGATTNATYVDVDALTYSPSAPWPTNTAGTGRALVRLGSTTVGSAPDHWVGTWPTPGWDDGDHDGLPDAWETAHAFDPANAADADGDPDGDGFTNRMEFLNGSDPREAGDALRPRVTVGGRGSLLFHLSAPPNLSVSLQRADTLTPGGWVTVRTVVTGPENAAALTLEETDTAGRFYRLTTQ